MSVWLREIAGWLLLALSLWVFWLDYDLLIKRRFLDVLPVTFVGYIIFRGGLHLIKVATAARACREASRVEIPTVRHRS